MHHIDNKLKTSIQYQTRGILNQPQRACENHLLVDSLQMDLGAQPEMFLLLLQEACRKSMKFDDFQDMWGYSSGNLRIRFKKWQIR